MKKALKITAGTLLAASLAAPAYASLLHRASVSGTLTYTEASNNGASMGDFVTDNTNLQNRRAFFVEPEHEVDFAVDGTFRLHGTDTRLFVSYDHFNDDQERDAANLRNLGINFVPPGGAVTSSHAVTENKAQEFRFGARHTLHFGQRFDLVLNGFLEYAKVERTLNERIAQNNNVHYRVTEDQMNGFGPGFGARGRVVLSRDYPNWGLFGGMNGSLLYADNEYSQIETRSTGATPAIQYAFTPEDSKSIVAKLDAEFGLDYTRTVNSDMARFLMSVALGARYMNVINAFKTGNTAFNPAVLGAGGAVAGSYANWTGSSLDWGRMGPFLQFRLGGAEA
jgi:hypothetical protein